MVLKKVLAILLGIFGAPRSDLIRRPGNCAHLTPFVTPLATSVLVAFNQYQYNTVELMNAYYMKKVQKPAC